MKQLFILLILISGCYLFPTVCAGQDIQFDHLNKTDGLPSDFNYYGITQDQQGFLWLGSLNGLVRYDGYEFVNYRRDPDDSMSISGNTIQAITESEDGMLWVGNYTGLNLLDPLSETFIRFRHDPDDPTSISSDSVRTILETRNGALWIGTSTGLNRLDRQTGTFTRFTHDPADPHSLSHDWINALHEDQAGTLWVGAGSRLRHQSNQSGGLNRFEPEQGHFTRFLLQDYEASTNNIVHAIGESSNGSLLIGTCYGRLFRFDYEQEHLEPLLPDPRDPNRLQAPPGGRSGQCEAANIIQEDRQGRIWLGTYNGGINRYDPVTHTLTSFRHNQEDPLSLSGNRVVSLYEDRQGVYWIGTDGKGVNKVIPSTTRFALYAESEIRANDGVRSVHLDHEGLIWIGTVTGQLFQFDPASKKTTRFSGPLEPDGLWSQPINNVYKDSDGTLWIGQQNGLYRINPDRGPHTHYTSDLSDPNSLRSQNISFISATDTEHLWISTFGGGLSLYDQSSEHFTTFNFDPSDPFSISSDILMTAYQDRQGVWWFGSYGGGVNRFDAEAEHPGSSPGEAFTTFLKGTFVNQIYEDRAGRFWVATGSQGLYLLDRKTGQSVQYDLTNGLPNNFVAGIVEDDNGLLWIATSGGISRFDPTTETFVTYNMDDGLTNMPSMPNAIEHDRDGTIYIGSTLGLTAFHPEDFINNFAEMVGEFADELDEEIGSTHDTSGSENTHHFKEILADLKLNAEQIAKHGRRADGIVSAMMQHASGGTGRREPTDVNALIDEYVNLAYHGKRAQVEGFHCEIERDHDESAGKVELIPQDIGRVLLNLLGNAFDAVSLQKPGWEVDEEPLVQVSTRRREDAVEIRVRDNGPGIPKDLQDKIFEPFFTTKPTGQGTGLGLSLSYDIITQGHDGTLSVESTPGKGATFMITLPT